MIKEIEEFENKIKNYKSSFFDKVWEKHDGNYKLIYNIQELVTDNNDLYLNLKFIFWLNADKNMLVEDVITYLYGQNCDYRSEPIDEDISITINKILSYINKEESNVFLRSLLLDGQNKINKIIDKENIKDFAQSIDFIPHKNVSCLMTIFKFNLIMNSGEYTFLLKPRKDMWELIYDEKSEIIHINNVYKKLIEFIYEAE